MTKFRAFAAFFMPSTPRFTDIAIGEMTDSQLRRAGISKSELLHVKFSGLSSYG